MGTAEAMTVEAAAKQAVNRAAVRGIVEEKQMKDQSHLHQDAKHAGNCPHL